MIVQVEAVSIPLREDTLSNENEEDRYEEYELGFNSPKGRYLI